MFDFISFFNDYGIKYWTEGKNVASGGTNTRCPHCGDHSNHLGWFHNSTYCWRCGYHSLYDSIKETLGCDDKMVELIFKTYKINDAEFKRDRGDNIIHPEHLEMIGGPLNDIHKHYLEGRGFDPDYIEWKYKLRGTFASDDGWDYRIITPIFYNNRLVSYQGRDFTGRQSLRYKTLSKDKEVIHHKDILFNIDNCKKDKVILVEGTYDALKLDDDSCATFGIGYKDSQLVLLRERFNKVFIMFDPEEEAQKRAEEVGKKLKLLGVDAEKIIIDEASDPAELTLQQVKDIKKELRI